MGSPCSLLCRCCSFQGAGHHGLAAGTKVTRKCVSEVIHNIPSHPKRRGPCASGCHTTPRFAGGGFHLQSIALAHSHTAISNTLPHSRLQTPCCPLKNTVH